MRPLSQTKQQQSVSPLERSFSTYSPFHQQHRQIDFPKQTTNFSPSRRRYTSIDRPQQNYERSTRTYISNPQLEHQNERQDNFNDFISDIDRRIAEKEKMIN